MVDDGLSHQVSVVKLLKWILPSRRPLAAQLVLQRRRRRSPRAPPPAARNRTRRRRRAMPGRRRGWAGNSCPPSRTRASLCWPTGSRCDGEETESCFTELLNTIDVTTGAWISEIMDQTMVCAQAGTTSHIQESKNQSQYIKSMKSAHFSFLHVVHMHVTEQPLDRHCDLEHLRSHRASLQEGRILFQALSPNVPKHLGEHGTRGRDDGRGHAAVAHQPPGGQ